MKTKLFNIFKRLNLPNREIKELSNIIDNQNTAIFNLQKKIKELEDNLGTINENDIGIINYTDRELDTQSAWEIIPFMQLSREDKIKKFKRITVNCMNYHGGYGTTMHIINRGTSYIVRFIYSIIGDNLDNLIGDKLIYYSDITFDKNNKITNCCGGVLTNIN